METEEVKKELSDWVPPEGWTVEVRKRKRGRYKSSNYTCYTDPITKLTFYSKPEVLRFLESDSNNSIRARKREDYKANEPTSKPCTVDKVVIQELPPGWTVDIRVRNRKKGCKRKIDKLYTDPETGHVFCSMKQVLHYLETGDITDRKSKKKRLINVKLTETPCLPAGNHKKRGPAIKASRNTLQCHTDKDFGLKLPSKVEKKRVHEIKASKKVIHHQSDKDRDSKLQSRGEGDGYQDWKAKKKITEGTSRTKGDFPGNMSVSPPSQATVPASPAVNGKSLITPERSTTLNENRITERGKGAQNDEKEAADAEITSVEVDDDELIGKTVSNQAHGVSVIKLSEGSVDFKGTNSSEVHRRELKIRVVLKQLQGPVLLPAGYIPFPPAAHHTSPLHYALTDPCFARGRTTPTSGGEGYAHCNDNLPWTSANVWDDPCFHFAVKTLASEF